MLGDPSPFKEEGAASSAFTYTNSRNPAGSSLSNTPLVYKRPVVVSIVNLLDVIKEYESI